MVLRLICSTLPDTNLILENQKEAGNDVSDEILRAKAYGEPGNAGTGQNRHDVDRQFTQEHHDCDEADDHGDESGENARERAGSALPLEIGRSMPIG